MTPQPFVDPLAIGVVRLAPPAVVEASADLGSLAGEGVGRQFVASAGQRDSVLDFIEQNKLFGRVAPAGEQFLRDLEPLRKLPLVGDIRGRGLLWGIEFVRDAAARQPFPAEAGVAARVYQAALAEGIVSYPIQGCVDGESGDHILLAPPFILSAEESQKIARGLEAALTRVVRELGAN